MYNGVIGCLFLFPTSQVYKQTLIFVQFHNIAKSLIISSPKLIYRSHLITAMQLSTNYYVYICDKVSHLFRFDLDNLLISNHRFLGQLILHKIL